MKKFLLVLLIIPVLLVCNKYLPEDKLSEKIINYKIYSDEQNDSYIPYQSDCLLKIIWERPNEFLADSLSPLHIAVKDSLILTWYGSSIDIRRKDDGEFLWQDRILPIADFDLKEEGFVTIDNFGFYVLLNIENRTEEKISLPFLSIQSRLFFSNKSGKEVSYCYQSGSTPSNSPSDYFSGPEFNFSKFLYDNRKFVWQFTRPEIVKSFLRTVNEKKIIIVTENNVYSFNSDATSDEQVNKLEIGHIYTASLDHSGNILMYLEEKEGKPALQSLSEIGKKNWSFKLENTPSVQPPASHPGGNIYIIDGNILKCINNGKSIWSYQLPSKPGKAMLTIIEDASVLVSSERLLLHISSKGVLLEQKLFDFPLTCRPVIDSGGNIFIATQRNIYCLK